jgi:hypothetical protein
MYIPHLSQKFLKKLIEELMKFGKIWKEIYKLEGIGP